MDDKAFSSEEWLVKVGSDIICSHVRLEVLGMYCAISGGTMVVIESELPV